MENTKNLKELIEGKIQDRTVKIKEEEKRKSDYVKKWNAALVSDFNIWAEEIKSLDKFSTRFGKLQFCTQKNTMEDLINILLHYS